jgi:hypothetical protein
MHRVLVNQKRTFFFNCTPGLIPPPEFVVESEIRGYCFAGYRLLCPSLRLEIYTKAAAWQRLIYHNRKFWRS